MYVEVSWGKPATRGGFARSYFTSGDVLGLGKESVQVGKRACDRGGSSTTLTLTVVPVFFRADR